MKKATRRLLGAIFALVVAVAVSIGATFAWFTQSDTATVSGITGTVTSGDASLEVRLVSPTDGTQILEANQVSGSTAYQWSYNLDLSKEFGALKAMRFNAVTYKSATELQTRDKSTATAVSLGGSATAAYATATGDYVDFYLELRSQKEVKVYLGEESAVTAEGAFKNEDAQIYGLESQLEAYYGTAVSLGSPIEARAANAVRVGFVVADTFEGLATPGDDDHIWCPNEGNPDGSIVAVTEGVKDEDCKPQGYWKGQLSKDIETKLSLNNTDYDYPTQYSEKGIVATGKEKKDNSLVASLTAADGSFKHQYMHVVIWLEGTDGDCFNNIFNDQFKVNIVLQADAEAE